MAVYGLVLLGGGLSLVYRVVPYFRSSLRTQPPPIAENAPTGGFLPSNEPPAVEPESMPDSTDRVADARQRRAETLRRRFTDVGLSYPPREVFLRVFKQEGQLELWARSAADPATPLRLTAVYPIQRASGRLGPKRREGDGQVPEGFYTIDRFNPRSSFHLSLGLDYPNASDKIFANKQFPGYDIFIHGGAQSAGCMAMGDAAAEEIYLAASDACAAGQRTIAAHVFPCRMTPENWGTLLSPRDAAEPNLADFWRGLQPGFDYFEQHHRVPEIQVEMDGRYTVATSNVRH